MYLKRIRDGKLDTADILKAVLRLKKIGCYIDNMSIKLAEYKQEKDSLISRLESNGCMIVKSEEFYEVDDCTSEWGGAGPDCRAVRREAVI